MTTLAEIDAEIARREKVAAIDAEIARRQSIYSDVPDADGNISTAEPTERSFLEQAEGVGEAALTSLTGATTGAIGYGLGSVQDAIDKVTGGEDRKLREQYADALTNTPESEAGQEYVKAIGDTLGVLPPVLGTAPAVGANALRSTPIANTKRVIENITPDNVDARNASAAQTDLAIARDSQAQGLPVPISLTKGQREQDLPTQTFERETAKSDLGQDLRQRFTEQNEQILQNVDSFIDQTGTNLPDSQSSTQTGSAVDRALRSRSEADKRKINKAYDIADESPESSELVDLSGVGDYLDENSSGMSSSPIMKVIEDEVNKQGYGSGKILDGDFNIGDMTLKQSEQLRKTINKFTKDNDATDIRVASQVKSLIDDATKDSGGKLYKRARKLRTDFAKKYERSEIIKKILANKRGSNDRQIPLEQIKNKVVDSGSVDDLKQVKRLLTSYGDEGKQAFKEIQAQTLKDLKSSITSNVTRDPNGNPIVSAAKLDRAVNALDKNGKLDIVFGSEGADQIRFLNDVAKDVYVSQPGAVNMSNTSNAIVAALDLMSSAFVGLPLPIAIGTKKTRDKLKNRRTKKKIKESLN